MTISYTFHDLKVLTIAQLRDIAKGLTNESVQGYSQMNKDHLLPALCQALGIDTTEHHSVVGIDKSSIKAKMRELKDKRTEAIDRGDHDALKSLRRQLHHLNHQLRSHMQ